MRGLGRVLGGLLAMGIILSRAPALPSLAQLDMNVAEDVAASTVMLAALIVQTENGEPTEFKQCFMGSGTIVSADARYILTNYHVMRFFDLAASFAADTEAKALADFPGRHVTYEAKEIVVYVVDHRFAFPDRRYRAVEVTRDEAHDLALLRITGDSPGRNHELPLRRPHLALALGDIQPDRVILAGFPAIDAMPEDGSVCASVPETRSIQMFQGTVSGVSGPNLDQLLVTASGSGGMSGGAAVDVQGRLIGIPAEIERMATGGEVEVIPISQAAAMLEAAIPGITTSMPKVVETPPATATPPATPTGTPTPPPTPTWTPTATPPPPTRTPTPTPTPAPDPTAMHFLPTALPLDDASCFRVDNDGLWSIDDVVGHFGDSAAARQKLRAWGWYSGGFRSFICDNPPKNQAGWIEINVHVFANETAAQEAVDYFASTRANGIGLTSSAAPPIGDRNVALFGSVRSGNEFTLYASSGPLLARVTGISQTGFPSSTVLAVMQALVTDARTGTSSASAPPPGSAYIPRSLPLVQADCFRIGRDQVLTLDELSRRYANPAEAARRLQEWGWQGTAYREFMCDNPPPGAAGWIDVSVHRFGSAEAAQEALDYSADARIAATGLQPAPATSIGDRTAAMIGPASNGDEYTLYASAGPVMVRVTGISPSAAPISDVTAVMQAIVSAAEPG